MNERSRIVNILREKEYFTLVGHILPDGDCIGSLLALGEALSDLGKQVKIYLPGIVPRKYMFLRGSEKFLTEGMELSPGTVAIAVDCSDLERLGPFSETIKQARCLLNIDHHITNQHYGTENLIDTKAAATGEIIFHLLADLEIPLTDSIAEALYVAVSTDTGSFKYDNTTPETHRIAADLLEYNVHPGVLSQRIFDERPLSYYLLLREALSSLELLCDSRIAVITISKEMLKRSGTTVEEIDGMINYTRDIEGVELGIMFYVESSEEVKIGFRSKTIDVSALAQKMNGGGHPRAAGCRVNAPYPAVKEKVIQEAEILLKKPCVRFSEAAWTGS
jgi:phosphoesterase RecJ-like protein